MLIILENFKKNNKMSTYLIPNTAVEAKIIEPRSGYASIFLGYGTTENDSMMASVNAGTSNFGSVFAVGLGGINGSFARKLTSTGQDCTKYQTIHQSIFDSAGDNVSGFQNKFGDGSPIIFSLMLKPDPVFNLPKYDGIVFIDIFESSQLPNQNARNYAMVYLVPPNSSNYKDNDSFLKAVEASNVNILMALSMYNETYASAGNELGLKEIQTLRMCLFSGGIYRGNSITIPEVAKHNLRGLELGVNKFCSNANKIQLVEFENSHEHGAVEKQKVFQSIVDKLSTSEEVEP